MIPNKLDKKYYLPIWLCLIFATIVQHLYVLIVNFSALAQVADATNLTKAITSFEILLNAILPIVMCYVYALLTYQLGFSRYVRCISRNDFCYLTMAHIACSRLLMGVIDIFSLVNPNLDAFLTGMMSPLFNGAAMFVMFFVTFKKLYDFNPVERYRAFSVWGTIFMIGGAIVSVLGNGAVLLLADEPQLLIETGLISATDRLSLLTAGCATGMAIYGAYLIATIVLGVILKKAAANFRDPETRGQYYQTHTGEPYRMRNDASDVFGADSPHDAEGDDNVFDEFDL